MEHFERNKFIYSGVIPLLFVLVFFIIKIIEVHFELSFVRFGVLPRTIEGLKGVVLAPLIHGDWTHLFNNSIPLLILGWAIFYFYRSLAPKVIFWSYLLAGLYTWISARNAFHIGASGLVYALFGFLMISGFLRKYIPLVALSFLVAFLYGSLIWGILPWDKTISWEGHFWGLLVGLVLALFYRNQGPQRKEFVWPDEEEDPTVLGDYVEFEEEEVQKETKLVEPEVIYHFVPTNKEDKE
ncbi:MAG: rhomboid family intramembrane serine protease [Flavobacteriales bacterium]|nr:rhomboid family intramembrane serine protease [Flavobacteriales bacterium]